MNASAPPGTSANLMQVLPASQDCEASLERRPLLDKSGSCTKLTAIDHVNMMQNSQRILEDPQRILTDMIESARHDFQGPRCRIQLAKIQIGEVTITRVLTMCNHRLAQSLPRAICSLSPRDCGSWRTPRSGRR